MTTQKQKYLKAIKKLEEAKSILEEIKKENQRDYDSTYFAHRIGEMLSCDNDESGLKPFVNSLK